ncbi:MAG: hypothetical protein KA746_12660 [Pyrinomonadaceae bacterium]|nr:hypothetical protein [Pyrinomonadaceae bacterium]MBP6212098.1 hypothetical protein [Pyrinomonadaceae bacterium]
MSKKHVNTPADFDKGYEENDIGLKGIVYFGVGLFLLIVITFGLMWAFLGVMRDFAKETAGPPNPMIQSDKDRLPAEPRLQGAPGFGVDSEKGRINLELTVPQSEYWELKKQWDEQLDKGRIDPKTGTVISMPINKAKEKFLAGTIKAKSGAEAEKFYKEAHKFYSDASAGRMASETQR